MSYFISFINFDYKHQHSNKLYHIGMILLEGDIQPDHTVKNIKALGAYGYNSHSIPKNSKVSWFETLLNLLAKVNFRINGSYAELKEEELKTVDLGFGLFGGPIIEISQKEKEIFLETIQQGLAAQTHFFATADMDAENEIANKGVTCPVEQADIRKKHREICYEQALFDIDQEIAEKNLQPDILIEETAHASGLISQHRLQQEKLKILKNIEIFDFRFSPQGSTCKTLAFNTIEGIFQKNEGSTKRPFSLSEYLMESYYTQPIPVLSKNQSKIIFNTKQKNGYRATTNTKIPFPARDWHEENISCDLVGFEQNTYMDLQGNEHSLQSIDSKDDYFTILQNLAFLKRLLNDFCNPHNNYQLYINHIDQAVDKCVNDSHDIHAVINHYHAVLKQLKRLDCFANIGRDIFKTDKPITALNNIHKHIADNDIKLEDGVRVEIDRLKKITSHADVPVLHQEMLQANDIYSLVSKKISYFSNQFFSLFAPKKAVAEKLYCEKAEKEEKTEILNNNVVMF